MPLDLTRQVEAVVRARGYYQDYEQRFSNYGAFKAYFDGGQALLPKDSIEAIKNAQNIRAISFPVFQKQALSIITSQVCTFTGVEVNSAKPLFSSITRGFAIKTFPKVGANNMLSEVDQYANGLVNGIRSILGNLDSFAAAQLEANRSTGLAAVGTTIAGVSIAANAYQVNLANRNNLYLYLPTLMELNDANTGNLINVMSTQGKILALDYETRGVNNAQNLRGALEGDLPSASGYRHYTSNRVTNGVGVAETHYVAPFGSLGLFTFVDSDARAGIVNGVNGKKMYVMSDPILGIDWAVTEEPICEDLSATYGAGYESCNGTQYRFMANFSFMNAYSSDTTRPIHKVEVMTT